MGVAGRYAGLVLLLVGAALGIKQYGTDIAGGADSSGFYNASRALADARWVVDPRPVRGLDVDSYPIDIFAPLDFQATHHGRHLAPLSALGFPLHLAIAGALLGHDETGLEVIGLCSLLALLLFFWVARELELSVGWATGATLAFALFPPNVLYALQVMGDVPSLCWCLATIWFCLRARRQPAWAILAGLAFSMAVLIRMTNVLLLPAVVATWGFRPRLYWRWIVGGTPLLAGLLTFNSLVYGHPFSTSYPTSMKSLFALKNFWPRFGYFWTTLTRMWGGPILLLWAASLLGFARRHRPVVILACWFWPYLLFYSFYWYANQEWYFFRYFLPGLPGLFLAAMLAAQRLAEWCAQRAPARARLWIGALVAFVVLGSGIHRSIAFNRTMAVLKMPQHDQIYLEGARLAWSKIPPDGLVVCFTVSGMLTFYGPWPILRADLIGRSDLEAITRQLHRVGTPTYALLLRTEQERFGHRLNLDQWDIVTETDDLILFQRPPWRRLTNAPPP